MEAGGTRYLSIDIDESMREFDKDEQRRHNMWIDIFQVSVYLIVHMTIYLIVHITIYL